MTAFEIDKNIEILRNNGWDYTKIPVEIRECREIALETVKHRGAMLYYMSSKFRNDKEIAIEALKNNCYVAIDYIGNSLKNNVEIATVAVQRDAEVFYKLTKLMRANDKIASLAIKLNSGNYKYALGEIKNDCKIAMKVIKDDPWLFEYCGDSLKDDYSFVLKTVKLRGNALKYVSERLKEDRKIVSAAVGENGTALEYAPYFADDNKIVSKAIKQNGMALLYASDRLKKDKKYKMKAVEISPSVVNYLERQDDYDTKENKEECKKIAKKQNVDYFVHFTNIRNLSSILKYGLLTRNDLDTGFYGQTYCITDESRLDNMRNTISLSVTVPNKKMFYIKRETIDANWCVLRMKADTILDHNCYFFSNNAARHEYNEEYFGIARDKRNSCYDFMSMFHNLKDEIPSGETYNVQAEVMCGERIPRSEIDSIVFRDEKYAELFRNDLKRYGIESVVDENYFC